MFKEIDKEIKPQKRGVKSTLLGPVRIAQGMLTTLSQAFRKPVTTQYPEEKMILAFVKDGGNWVNIGGSVTVDSVVDDPNKDTWATAGNGLRGG